MKAFLKKAAESICFIFLVPAFIVCKIGLLSFTTISHGLSLIPGLPGIYVRRAWYRNMLKSCGEGITVDFLGFVRSPKTSVGNDCYVGVGTSVGQAKIGDDVLISGGTSVLSGSRQHGKSASAKIREQVGCPVTIKIGSDVWIGANTTIMADIPQGCIVGAGSVVTKSPSANEIIAGVPARAIGTRK